MAEQRPDTTSRLAASARPERGAARGEVWRRGLPLAVQFLTVLPVRVAPPRVTHAVDGGETAGAGMAAALPWFPLVGAALGALTALVDWALAPVFAIGVRDVLLLALPLLLTGMLHADGFVDCCDALLGARSVERRLEILRDSRVGAYGALGGALLLLGRYAALGALAGPVRPVALVVAPLLGRWGIVYAVTRYRYARPAGLGALFRSRPAHLLGASLVALVLLVATGAGVVAVAGAGAAVVLAALVVAAFVVTLCWCVWASRRLGGGLTGDTYGALNELVELAVLLLAPPLATAAPHLCAVVCR